MKKFDVILLILGVAIWSLIFSLNANAQDRLENALIRYYNPEYNQTSVNVKPRKKDFEIVEALQS